LLGHCKSRDYTVATLLHSGNIRNRRYITTCNTDHLLANIMRNYLYLPTMDAMEAVVDPGDSLGQLSQTTMVPH